MSAQLILDLSPETAGHLEKLRDLSGKKDVSEVVTLALALLSKAVDNEQKGGVLIFQSRSEEKCRKWALCLLAPDDAMTVHPAQRLGWSCSAWGGREGVDHFELHWPTGRVLQFTVDEDRIQIIGPHPIGVTKTACNALVLTCP